MTNRDHLSPPPSSPPNEEQPTNQESFFATPPEPTSSLIGQEIGSFRLVEIIGRGGFGAVYRAEHLQLRQSFALKLLHLRAETQDPIGQQTIQRFHREARTLATLKHPNIVQISDFGLAHLHYYFVMEYLPGDTLRQRMKRLGPLPLDQIEDIAGQICSALEYIHDRNILHRDLKPSNFLLVFDPITQKEQVKLIDFGIASLSDGLSITVAGTFLGSPTYMSPEQAEGRIKAMDARSDLYSLGILVYQMLCGKPPFEGKSMATLLRSQILTPPPPLSEKLPSIPWSQPLERFLKRCLAKNVIDRPVDARLFFSELQAAFHAQRIFLHKSSSPDTSPSLPLNPAYFSDTRDTTVLPAYSQEAAPSPSPSPPRPVAPPLSPRTEESITATNPALSSSEPSFSLFPTQPQADPPFDAPSDEGLGMTRPREGFAHPSMQTQRRPGFSQPQGGFFQDDEIEGETELDSSPFRSPPPSPPASVPKPAFTVSFSDTQVSTPSPVLQDPLAALQALPSPSSPQRPVNPPLFTQSPFPQPQAPPSGSTPLFSSSPSPSRGILASVPMPSAKMISPSGGSPASGLSASSSSLPSPSPSASSPPSDEPGRSPSLSSSPSSSSSPKLAMPKAFTPSSSPQFSTRIEPAAPDTTLPSAPSSPPTKHPSGSNASASSPRVSASPVSSVSSASSPRIFASPSPSSSSPRLSAGSDPAGERGAASVANALSPSSGPTPTQGNPPKPLASPAPSIPPAPASPSTSSPSTSSPSTSSPFESSDAYKTQVDKSSPIASVSSEEPSFQTQIDRPSSAPSAPASQAPSPLSSASSFDTQEDRVPESAVPSLLKTPTTFVVPRNLKPPRKQGRSWWWVGLLLFAAGVGLVLYFFV